MTNTICGHERDALVATLNVCVWQTGIDYDVVPMDVFLAARAGVFDPVALATMLAEEGRRLGFVVPGPHDQTFWDQLVVEARRHEQMIELDAPEDGPSLKLTMPQARAILLQWLRLPDGAREEAERVLRSEPSRDARVDWSNDLRPAVLGGECARCFHRAPLHEPGCVLLKCVAPNPCACRQCFKRGET